MSKEYTDDQMKEAIAYLETPKATKKRACEILGIKYNTKRLDKEINEWKEDQARDARLRKEKRRQPCTPEELVNIIESYLMDNSSFEELSKRFYRSTAYIRHRLDLAGALIKDRTAANPLNPATLPDECMLLDEDFRCRERVSFEVANQAEYDKKLAQILHEKGWDKKDIMEVYQRAKSFDTKRAIDRKGELAWVPAYQCLGEVISEVPCQDMCKAFRVFLLDADHHKNVYIKSWDLGSLRHLELLGVNISNIGGFMNGTNCTELLNKALKAAKRGKE